MVPRPVIGGSRQVDSRRLHRRQREDRRAVGVVEPRRVWLARLEPRRPVGLGKPQVHLREVAVGDANNGPGCRPRLLRGQRQFPRLDLCDQVFAELSTGAVGVPFDTFFSDGPCLDEVIVLTGDLGESVRSLGSDLVVARLRQKRLQRVGLAIGHGDIAGIDRHTRGPQDPVEVGSKEGRAVGVGRVEVEQFAIEPGCMQDRRVGVGDRLLLLRIPRAEVRSRAEDRTRSLQFKGVLRRGEAAFAR